MVERSGSGGGDASLRELAGDGLELVAGDPGGPGGMRRPSGPGLRGLVKGVAAELRMTADHVEEPQAEAERLVCHALGLRRHQLLEGDAGPHLRPGTARRLAGMVLRRVAGEPLQYIEGSVQFRDLVLRCDHRALIPRPETEQLVERAAGWIRRRPGGSVEGVLDVGTGSGAIALALLAEDLAERAVGLDVSSAALQLAAENRELLEIPEERFELRLVSGRLWSSVGSGERFDLVISNPPYVSDAELHELPAEIREHEPPEALAGGEDGLDTIREILSRGARYLRPQGRLYLEIAAGQAEPVRELMDGSPEWGQAEIRQDLAGRDRFAVADPA